MLTQIDRYILRKFLTTFIFCMLLFTVIAVAVDSSEKTDDFVKAGLSTGAIIRDYYVGFVPYIWGLLFPLFVFIAVIFFTSKMALRSEIIAILASGVSFNRWLRPYLVGGLLFAAILWAANRYAIPRANGIRTDFETTYLGRNNFSLSTGSGCWNCFYRRVDSNTYIGIRNYDTAARAASSFFLERIRNNRMYYNLRAERIAWNPDKKSWRLTNAVERTIDGTRESVRRIDSMYLSLNIRPDELRKDDYLKDKLTTPELRTYIEREELRGAEGLSALKVEQYRRSATPFTVLLLTLIGAIIASRKTRGGSGLHLAIGIAIAAVFILSDRFSTVFSTKGNLPPLLAAWIPNLVFTFVAVYVYRKAPK